VVAQAVVITKCQAVTAVQVVVENKGMVLLMVWAAQLHQVKEILAVKDTHTVLVVAVAQVAQVLTEELLQAQVLVVMVETD
jgi:hypothetical protein